MNFRIAVESGFQAFVLASKEKHFVDSQIISLSHDMYDEIAGSTEGN